VTTASRSLATALRKARFASGLLPPSYTTPGDTIPIDRRADADRATRRLVAAGPVPIGAEIGRPPLGGDGRGQPENV